MPISFPTAITGWYAGYERSSGSFQRDDGEKIEYGARYLIHTEDREGIAQMLPVTVAQADDACDGFTLGELPKFTEVTVTGEVVLATEKDRRSFFRPVKIELNG